MDLYLVRHAIAADRAVSDDARPLTPEGRRRFEREVVGLQQLGVRFDRVLHSPALRALETAQLLVPCTASPLQSEEGLARPPGRALLERLEGECVALVGHEPWMSSLAAWLVFGDGAAGGGLVLKKGGVVWLDGEPRPGEMRLRALLPPHVLRASGGASDGAS